MVSGILTLNKRIANAEKFYSNLSSLEDLGLTDFLKKAHNILLDGADLTKTKRYNIEHESTKVKMKSVKSGTFRDDYPYSMTRLSGISFICPSSNDLDLLMQGLESKYDSLLRQCNDLNDILLVTSWTMSTIVAAHPVYRGAGRMSRATLPYTLLKTGHSLKYIENKAITPYYTLNSIMVNELLHLVNTDSFNSCNIFKKEFHWDPPNYFGGNEKITHEYLSKYYDSIKNAFMERNEKISISLLYRQKNHQAGAKILKKMPAYYS